MNRPLLSTVAAAAGVAGVLVTSHVHPMSAHAAIGATGTTGTSGSTGTSSSSGTSSGSSSGSSSSGSSGSSSGSSGSSGSSSGSSSSSSSSSSGTYTGDVATHQFGPVQVEITVSGGQITDITLAQQPSDGKSRWINSQAVPILVSEALKAQSASIDGVSGATLTSHAFVASLASAIQKAGL